MNSRVSQVAPGILALAVFLVGPVGFRSQNKTNHGTPSKSVASSRVRQIADEYWSHVLEHDVYQRLRIGAQIDFLPDLSEKTNVSEAAFARHILDELAGIRAEELNHEDQLTLRLLQWQEHQAVESSKYFWFPFPVTPYASPLSLARRVYIEHPFRSKSDLDHYLAILGKYPSFVGEITDRLRSQASRGIVMPKDELPTVNAFLSSYIQPPEKSPFFVAQDRLRNIDPALIHPFQQNLAQLIASQINPSIQALLGYLNGDYASKAPQGVGLSQYPSGKEYYRFLVHNYTTLEVSPDEVHRIGLAAVEKDEAKMAEMRRTIGFQGTSEDFNRFVKTNERFFPKTPEEIEARLMSYVSRVRNVVGSYFAELPKAPYGVKRLDPALEAGETFGHYDQPSASEPMGIYYFNGSNLQERSLFNAAPLILHELVPGHHFQINLQTENRALPEFRRQTFPAAYTEGWGDYSAKLGQDMGVYQEPYDFYACLAMDMFISVRLVVDTGMNDKGWSRSKAVEFMRQHELEADAQIQSESLRYSVDIPGQALAYKMGSLELSKLRDATKTKLGDHFDIKRFHACVLNSGAMPLTILKDHVEWCMQNPPVAN